jgi:hypothetical protein
MIEPITTHMAMVPPPIRERTVATFASIDGAFGKRMSDRCKSTPVLAGDESLA